MSDVPAVVGWPLARRPRAERHKHRRSTAVWREQALAEIAARKFSLERLEGIAAEQRAEIQKYLKQAEESAAGARLSWSKRRSSTRGASIERTWGLIDAAEESLLQVAPADFVAGQLPRIRRRAQLSFAPDDPRRIEVEEIARRHVESTPGAGGRELLVVPRLFDADLTDAERAKFVAALAPDKPQAALTQPEREALVSTFHAANGEARRKHTRIRSFRNMLLSSALVLAIAAAGVAALGMKRPGVVPLCFHPGGQVVCPTKTKALDSKAPASGQPTEAQTARAQAREDRVARRTAQPYDMLLVELMGLIGAALAAAATLRRMTGTSTPYAVPLALAVLKLPTGALTAALGLLLMRGEFVPGLTSLDSPAQIIAWAIVFGYAQEIFTRLVDNQAHSVLNDVGSTSPTAQAANG
jgi:hypothetical protein